MPPTGVEPAHPPPEGGALSTELRGLAMSEPNRTHTLLILRSKGISERIGAMSTQSTNSAPQAHANSQEDSEVASQEAAQVGERAYFATGCFWGAERRFWNLDGVIATSVGYMGGTTSHPDYKEVCTGRTGHAEIVEVVFDPSHISYYRLLEEFWTMHDPTSLNAQGGDIGTQYRSAIYTTSAQQYALAMQTRDIYNAELKKNGMNDICTEIKSFEGMTYWLAEEYHQKYLAKNPNGYDCHSSTGIAYPAVSATK